MVDVVLGICTYRRPEGLLKLLGSLAEIDYAGSLSIVVIDNDRQQEGIVACQSLVNYRWPLVSAFEEKKGIAHARNHAVRLALQQKPQYIAMLDDDEWPRKQWLLELLRIQALNNADVVSGPVLPVFPENCEPWSSFPELYGADRPLADGEQCVLYASGNFLARTACFESMLPLPFDPEISKTGSDDMVFFRQLDKRGYSMFWAANAIVDESVAPARLSFEWQKRRHFTIGNTNVVVQRMFAPGVIQEAIRMIKTVGLLAYGGLFYVLTFWQPRLRIKATLLLYKARGKLMGHKGQLRDYLDHGGST